MIKRFGYLGAFTMILYMCIFIAMATVAWLYIYPPNIIDIHSIRILNSPIKAGDYLRYEMCFTKHKNYPAKIYVQLMNNMAQTFSAEDGNMPAGPRVCRTRYKRIPIYMEEDTDYQLKVDFVYKPTPLAEKVYSAMSDKFEIMNKRGR
jgi:hypothetical protein